ncbi:MAG: hypothetical protein CME20_08110 [Gemmatimonadetes bacterium]|nr:hypothetical protein [Gemmatimonadota bacterium]
MGADPHSQYTADGYYIHTGSILPAATVAAAVAGMDAVRHGEYDTGVPPRPSAWSPGDDPALLCKIEKPQIANRAIMELVKHPALGAAVAAVTGAEWIQVWWVQLLYKPPAQAAAQAGVNIGWHQDRNYWTAWEEGSELFTAWVALSEVGADAGPMQFVRGSHQWGLLEGSDFYGQDLAAQKRGLALPEGALWEEVAATMPRGGASIHHCLTVHGSGPNQSNGPRRSFAIHMRSANSAPMGGKREGLTAFIDDPDYCPIIWNETGV